MSTTNTVTEEGRALRTVDDEDDAGVVPEPMSRRGGWSVCPEELLLSPIPSICRVAAAAAGRDGIGAGPAKKACARETWYWGKESSLDSRSPARISTGFFPTGHDFVQREGRMFSYGRGFRL